MAAVGGGGGLGLGLASGGGVVFFHLIGGERN